MKQTVYLETSVISYLTANPSKDIVSAGHQFITHRWWEKERHKYNLVISELVILEAAMGDKQMAEKRGRILESLPVLESLPDANQLTKAIITKKYLPEKAAADAAHIAIATVHQMDYLLTWNCKHIANAKIFPKIFEIIEKAGYRPPVICTPEALLGGFTK